VSSSAAKAYYNEIDSYAAAWLRNLIVAGLIAPGDVDERSIKDVQSSDLTGYTQCHFFAGIGGWSLALRLAGWPDDTPVWSGSCPCQPFSVAGKQRGFDDHRHLWPEFFRLIRECRPTTVFGEQVAGTAGLIWADTVAADFESESYAFGSIVFPAVCVKAPHERERLYFVSDAGGAKTARGTSYVRRDQSTQEVDDPWRNAEGALNFDSYERLDDGIPSKLAKAIAGGFGNAIVPQVAAEFIRAFGLD